VTGGTGILGRSFSAALASFGANVVVLDLIKEEVVDFSRELSIEFGVDSLGISCDTTSESSVKRSIEEISSKFKTIDILHNNAQGKTVAVPFEECTLEDWRLTSSVNEEGYFLMAQAVGKKMIAQGVGGSIIQTSSIYGVLGPDHRIYEGATLDGKSMGTRAVYSFSKAGVVGLTKYLATYWADNNIRVNTLTPGGVQNGQSSNFIEQYSNRVPLGRMAKKEDMVGALIYLASDASSYVTGQNIIVDGGLEAW
jgi:NAD(P)-dependent dehydrogenase (short-subunit alcohol dehydrogenase family)